MAVENIEVQITADDSGFLESIEEMNTEALELDATAKDLNKSLDKAFQPRQVQSYQGALKGTTQELGKQERQVKKNTKGFSSFNKAGGRGVSMLSRFSGVGGRATRSLGGVASALSGTPFGGFALAAGAATLAYSFFSDQVGEDTDAIIEKNKELELSVSALANSLKIGFQEGKLISIDLDVLKGLSESEATTKRILVFEESIGSARARSISLIQELNDLESKLSNKQFKSREDELIAEKELITLKKERLGLANLISSNEAKILREQLSAENRIQAARDASRKRAIQAQNLFDSLIRDELQKRIKAIEKAADIRDKKAKENISSRALRNKFLLESERVLNEDRAKLIKEFGDAETKARKALLGQLIKDEEGAAIAAAKRASDDRLKQIDLRAKDDAEKADFIKLNEAKLQADILEIQSKFAAQRKQEGLKEQQELFNLRSAGFESEALQEQTLFENDLLLEKQAFEVTKRTEEELTAFEKRQADEKLKIQLKFQIARAELAKKYNKELTDGEVAALEAQIKLLKTRLSGVGSEITASAQTDVKNGTGLFGLLGISEGTQQDVEAVTNAIQQVTQEVSKAVAERVRLLDEEVQKRESRISDLQGELQTEIELNKLGKASNIKEVQDQLKQEKAARDKAEQEKEEAAKAQFAIDTALQASNLITAISGLYSSLSGLPFGIGVALATALSGVMIGSFVASKVTAGNAAGFADGGQYGFTGAGSKQTKSSKLGDRPYDYHAGEYILPQHMVTEYGLDGVPINKAGEVLGEHFSDRIPDFRNSKAANARLKEFKAADKVTRRSEQSRVLKETFKEEFASQNKILNKQLKAIENMPVTTEIAKGVFRVQRGKNIEIIRNKS